VRVARFVAINSTRGNLSPGSDISTNVDAVHHPGAQERNDMEIAAILMFAAAVMGVIQQFDRQVW